MIVLGALEVRAGEVGCALTERGEPVVVALDSQTNTTVSIVFSPESWRAFLANAPRLKGVGIHLPNRAEVRAVADQNGGGEAEPA